MYVISNNSAKHQFSIKREFMLSVEKNKSYLKVRLHYYTYTVKKRVYTMRYIMRLIIMYNIIYFYMTFPTRIPVRALYEITEKAKDTL